MTYRADALRIAESGQRGVGQLVAELRAGNLTRDEFVDLAAELVAAHNAEAAGVADLALAVDLARLGRDVDPAGVIPDDLPRLRVTFSTILSMVDDNHPQGALSLSQIGRWAPLAAAQDAYAEGMRRQGVAKWRRSASTKACDVCRKLTGTDVPTSVSMYHHPGCSCVQQPVLV